MQNVAFNCKFAAIQSSQIPCPAQVPKAVLLKLENSLITICSGDAPPEFRDKVRRHYK